MEIGLGLDATLGLDWDAEQVIAREAAAAGYTSLWTPEGAGMDSFQICGLRWDASREAVGGGLTTGIGVCPVAYRSPVAFAMSAGTLSARSGGKFVLGLGSGGIYNPKARRRLGAPPRSTLTVMREYLSATRALLGGETLDVNGEAVTYHGVRLGFTPPPTPVLVGALGPEMIRLGGEVADGALLNWCTPEQVAWSRERLREGAARAGRGDDEVRLAEYIRICVDDDVDVARRAYARSLMGYALGAGVPTDRERQYGYRAHFERMGFKEPLLDLDRMRSAGASGGEVADAMPEELLTSVGYYGSAAGASDAFRALAEGLDVAIVRVVGARPGVDATRAVLQACAPGREAAEGGQQWR